MPRNNPQAYMQPSPGRSALVQQLMARSQSMPARSNSFMESANLAAQPIVAALLQRREQQAQQQQTDRQRQMLSEALGLGGQGEQTPQQQQLAALLQNANPQMLQGVQQSMLTSALTPQERDIREGLPGEFLDFTGGTPTVIREAPQQQVDSFEPVLDKQGNIVGQRNTRTGRVVDDPRAARDDSTRDERQISAYRDQLVRRRGMKPQEAQDMAERMVYGGLRMELTDTGNVRLLDTVSQTAREVPLQGLDDAIPEPDETRTLWDLSERATGPASAVAAGASRLPGVPVAEETIQARQRFRLAQQNLLSTLRSSGARPLALEMEQLFNAMQLEPSIIDQPEALRQRLVALQEELDLRIAQADRDAQDPRLPDETRTAQGSAAAAMRNFRATMGVPENAEDREGPLTDQEREDLERLRRLQGGQ